MRLPKDVTYDSLGQFVETVADRYPNKRVRQNFRAEFIAGGERGDVAPTSEFSGEKVGYVLLSPSGTEAVQARLDGFSFSMIQRYTDWDDFRGKARSLWDEFSDLFHPELVDRISLRYINRLELPLPFRDFEEYIRTVPTIAEGLPQALSNFLMVLNLPLERPSVMAVINETIEPVTVSNRVPLIFDVDVSNTRMFSPQGEDIWESFEELRSLKNRIFFESITDKTLELYE